MLQMGHLEKVHRSFDHGDDCWRKGEYGRTHFPIMDLAQA